MLNFTALVCSAPMIGSCNIIGHSGSGLVQNFLQGRVKSIAAANDSIFSWVEWFDLLRAAFKKISKFKETLQNPRLCVLDVSPT